METQYITLSHDRAKTVLHVVQGESGARTFVFSLIGATGQQILFEPEHKAFFYVEDWAQFPAQIDTTSHTVSVTLTAAATGRAGNHNCTLQVYNSAEDIWRGNMVLSVERNPAAAIIDDPDFIPLTRILQNAENIERLLGKSRDTDDLFRETLENYTEGMSAERSGKIQREDPASGIADRNGIAFDTAGNLLWLDGCKRGAPDTKLSADYGNSWTAAAPAPLSGVEDSIFYLAVGGEKFLLLGDDKLIWAKVSGDSLTTLEIADNPLKTKTAPCFFHGRWVNGKYWVFRNTANSAACPPAYFTGSGAGYAAVSLPDAEMVAHDVAYDPESGRWFLVGGYDGMFSEKAGKGWLVGSADLTHWETIKTWSDYSPREYKLAVQNGCLAVFFTDPNNKLKCHRMDIESDTWQELTVPGGESFQLVDAVKTSLGVAAIGSGKIAFSKNGMDFTILSVSFPSSYDVPVAAAASGRRLVLTNGPQYAVFRVDLAGAKMLDNLKSAEQRYSELEAELETAAGNRIIFTSTDPGQGADSSEPDGTLIFVYKE